MHMQLPCRLTECAVIDRIRDAAQVDDMHQGHATAGNQSYVPAVPNKQKQGGGP